MPLIDCTGDTVIPQLETSTMGASGGVSESYTDGTALDCLIQIKGGSESLNYQSRGQRRTHCIYFSSDPGLTNRHRLKWTDRSGIVHYLRVLATITQGRPGDDVLWRVDCDEETTRKET